MGKFNVNNYTKVVNNILGQIDEYGTHAGSPIVLYPFRLTSGFTNINETGEKDLTWDADSFFTNILVANSNEPMCAIWDNSYSVSTYTITQKNIDNTPLEELLQQPYIKKSVGVGKFQSEYHRGDFFYGFMKSYEIGTEKDTVTIYDKDYEGIMHANNIEVFVPFNENYKFRLGYKVENPFCIKLDKDKKPTFLPNGGYEQERRICFDFTTIKPQNVDFVTNAPDSQEKFNELDPTLQQEYNLYRIFDFVENFEIPNDIRDLRKYTTGYVFLIFDKKTNIPHFMTLSEIVPYPKPSGEGLYGFNLTFKSLNLAFAKSGRNILDFIQVSNGIGGEYVFPKEIRDSDGNISVSYQVKDNGGCFSLQTEMLGSVALSSIEIYGRQAHKIVNSKNIVEAPKRLLFYQPQPFVQSKLLKLKPNATNAYDLFCGSITFNKFWDSWLKKVEQTANPISERKYTGGLSLVWEVRCGDYDVNDKAGKPLDSDYKVSYNVMTPDFKYSIPKGGKEVLKQSKLYAYANGYSESILDLGGEKGSNMSICDIVNVSGFANYGIETLPISNKEQCALTTGKVFDSIPLVGGIIKSVSNFIFGDLSKAMFALGGMITSNLQNYDSGRMYIIPTETRKLASAAYGDKSNNYLPLNVFDMGQDNVNLTSLGAYNTMVGYNMSITDKFIIPNYAELGLNDDFIKLCTIETVEEIGKDKNVKIVETGNLIVDTMYLGQVYYYDENDNPQSIFKNIKPLKWQADFRATKPNNSFVINTIRIKELGKTEFRVSAYSSLSFGENTYSSTESIWETRCQSLSKFTNNSKIWNNEWHIEYPLIFKGFDPAFKRFPESLTLPDPNSQSSGILVTTPQLSQPNQYLNVDTQLSIKYWRNSEGVDKDRAHTTVTYYDNNNVGWNVVINGLNDFNVGEYAIYNLNISITGQIANPIDSIPDPFPIRSYDNVNRFNGGASVGAKGIFLKNGVEFVIKNDNLKYYDNESTYEVPNFSDIALFGYAYTHWYSGYNMYGYTNHWVYNYWNCFSDGENENNPYCFFIEQLNCKVFKNQTDGKYYLNIKPVYSKIYYKENSKGKKTITITPLSNKDCMSGSLNIYTWRGIDLDWGDNPKYTIGLTNFSVKMVK